MFHCCSGWLNECAWLKAYFRDVTRDVSQVCSGWLKAAAYQKVFSRLRTRDVSHGDTSSLKDAHAGSQFPAFVFPQKTKDRLVSRDTSHSLMGP